MQAMLAFPTHPAHNASCSASALSAGAGGGGARTGASKLRAVLLTVLVPGEGRALRGELCGRENWREAILGVKREAGGRLSTGGQLEQSKRQAEGRIARAERRQRISGSPVAAPPVAAHPARRFGRQRGERGSPSFIFAMPSLAALAKPRILASRSCSLRRIAFSCSAASACRRSIS